MMLQDYVDIVKGDLDSIHRLQMYSLITQNVHFRDLSGEVYRNQSKISDFSWLKNTRFYILELNQVVIK
jgi:hypothetical protein